MFSQCQLRFETLYMHSLDKVSVENVHNVRDVKLEFFKCLVIMLAKTCVIRTTLLSDHYVIEIF